MKRLIAISTIALLTAGLTGWSAFGNEKARSLREVGVIHVDANRCEGPLKNALRERGFGITDSSRKADAVLMLSMSERHNELVGKDGRYRAELIGDDDRVLFSTGGHENSINHGELCADISDDIADRLS